jgi:hypothetical protein
MQSAQAPFGRPLFQSKTDSGVETLRGTTIQDFELIAGARFGASCIACLCSGLKSYSETPPSSVGTIG